MSEFRFVAEPGQNTVVMSKLFDVPRERVFAALTDKGQIGKWWGPSESETFVDMLDPKKGGLWRFVQPDADANEHAFNGVYHLVDAPARIINTLEYEGRPGHVILESILLQDEGGRTRLSATSAYESIEDRDGMVGAGMEKGACRSWERLSKLLGD